MDATTFDRLVADAARRPTRRTTLRLLAGGLLGALLPGRAARAQRADSDGDGLFDDDETDVYGTGPFAYDTDGDGIGDGQEIYNRDNGLGGNTDPLVNENAAPAPPAPPPAAACPIGLTDCAGICTDLYDDFNCGACGNACRADHFCLRTGEISTPGRCFRYCPPPLTNCGGDCVDLQSHMRNCGGCQVYCAHGCTNGICH